MGTTSLAANQPRALLHSTALNDLMQRNWLRRSTALGGRGGYSGVVLLGAMARLFRGALSLLLFWVAVVAAAAVLSALAYH